MYLHEFNLVQLAALGALTVAAISAVAWAAIWTARSQRGHWYHRSLSLLALIGPLHWALAVYPWLVFVTQALIMLAVLAGGRAFRAWRAGEAARSFRVADVIAAMAYLALLFAPLGFWIDWLPSIAPRAAPTGLGFALIGLLGIWLATPPTRFSGYAARLLLYVGAPAVTVLLIDFAPPSSVYGSQDYWSAILLTWIAPLVIAPVVSPWIETSAASSASVSWRGRWSRRVAIAIGLAISLILGIGYAVILHDPGLPQAVPEDPFAPGQSIRFRREPTGCVVYCVGIDGIDDGGVPYALGIRGDYVLP